MQNFVVISADIKASRKLHDYERYEWQLFMKSAIVQINDNYRSHIEAPFMITKGDEFQGVLKNLELVSPVMLEFEHLLYPLRLRFGVGYGAIQKMGSNICIEMDGPAFHLASSALDEAKKGKTAVFVNTRHEAFDLSLNTIYKLTFSIKHRWNELQYKRYWKYKETGTCKRVALDEHVSAQAVWDSLHHSGALEVIKVEQAIRKLYAYRQLSSEDSDTEQTSFL